MRNFSRTFVAMVVAVGSLLSASNAFATSSVHGVAFTHGTGDYAGTQSCSGSGTSYKCIVQNAIDNYWTQAEVDAVRGGRPYVVTGQHGGSATPWNNPSPFKGAANETGTAYEVAAQLNRFLSGPDGVYGTADDITDLVVVTHSGGSNVLRYIAQHPTINTDFAHVQSRLRKIIGVAPPSKGTYLADRVFANDSSLTTLAGAALAGLMGFKDDGTKFIQTTEMSSTNADSAKLVNMSATQGGVPFYATGGMSTTKCFGVTVFGKCIGVTAGSLGGSNCDSFLMDTGLAALHNAFLNANDVGTARNNCSDGFIPCASSQAIGWTFGFSTNQDHNQSRRKCNGEDSNIAAQVNNAKTGFENEAYSPADVPVAQWDSCGFSKYASVSSGGSTIGYTAGCAKGDLGDGWCDWDCIATYGHDAAPTWDSTGTKVIGWGSTDDCTGTAATGSAPVGFVDTNDPWATGGYYGGDPGTYTADGASWFYTQFTGKVHSGYSTVWYTDPNNATTSSVGYCPQSWIGDGTCDECVLANYGNDGNDCLPGKVASCGGIIAKYDTAGSTTYNPIYNEHNPSSPSSWYLWNEVACTGSACAAQNANGTCDIGECKRNNWSVCSLDSDCVTGTCSGGYCTSSASTCNTTADCTAGTCVNGGCTTAGSDCSTLKSDGTYQSLCR